MHDPEQVLYCSYNTSLLDESSRRLTWSQTVRAQGLASGATATRAVTLLLLVGLPAAALSATGTVSPCATDAQDLTSLEVPGESLSLERVDHDAAETDLSGLEPLDAAVDAREAGAPVLNLTPRVANMLRDIFRAQDSVSDTDAAASISPIADSADDADLPETEEKIAPVAGADEEILPSFQQRMYRKDI